MTVMYRRGSNSLVADGARRLIALAWIARNAVIAVSVMLRLSLAVDGGRGPNQSATAKSSMPRLSMDKDKRIYIAPKRGRLPRKYEFVDRPPHRLRWWTLSLVVGIASWIGIYYWVKG